MFPNCTSTYVGVGPTYGVDGEMCPPFKGKTWKNEEDPTGPLWVVCAKEFEIGGTLGIPVTTLPEVPTRLVEAGGRTTQLDGVKGVVGVFALGAPTRGGGTPLSRATEVEVEEISPALDISFPTGTPITGELKG